jgi:hypothetical protein
MATGEGAAAASTSSSKAAEESQAAEEEEEDAHGCVGSGIQVGCLGSGVVCLLRAEGVETLKVGLRRAEEGKDAIRAATGRRW